MRDLATPPTVKPGDPLGPDRRDDLLGAIRALPTVGFLATTLVGFNLVQTASLVLAPFSRRAFRRFNRWCADVWWGWCVVAGRRVARMRLIITGDDVPAEENVIVVANHQQMPDIPVIMQLARSKRRLGDLKWFVKRAMRNIPGVGWGMRFLNCLFVERSWAADREMIQRTFATIVTERIPLWLISFSEGTRLTPAKLEASRDLALSRGIEPLRHVLLPRTKGFAASVAGLGDHITAVYDLTIGYADGIPSLWQYITGRVRQIHLHVRRFPIEQLPRLEHELADWLIARFREKDHLLALFHQHGRFPGDPIAGG
jgi:1-acyl-sn-glycerol-3-phosphate acyltransferase